MAPRRGKKRAAKEKATAKAAKQKEEKRAARYRSKAPNAFTTRRDRALAQRLYLIDREDTTTEEAGIANVFKCLGSTGNVCTFAPFSILL